MVCDTPSVASNSNMTIAMLNVCRQCSFVKSKKQSDLVDAYVLLFYLAGTNSNGFAADSAAGYAIQKYAKAICSIDIKYTFKRNTSVSYFTKAVDNNYSSILGLVGKGNVGHAVSVNGYIKYKNKKTGDIKTYLQVEDGWYSRTRCILYDSINVESTSGTVIQYATR